MSSSDLFLGIFWGAFGSAYFVWGRKQMRIVALVSGLLLITLSFWGLGAWSQGLVGILLIAAPWLIRS